MTTDHPDLEPPEEMEHRLDAVEQEIEQAERDAKEHRTIPGKHEPTFIDPDDDGRVEDDGTAPPA